MDEVVPISCEDVGPLPFNISTVTNLLDIVHPWIQIQMTVASRLVMVVRIEFISIIDYFPSCIRHRCLCRLGFILRKFCRFMVAMVLSMHDGLNVLCCQCRWCVVSALVSRSF